MAEPLRTLRARRLASLQPGETGWRLGLATVAALAAGMHLYATRFGPGVVGDSVWYIAGARQLMQGLGYTRLTGDGSPVPITAFPPLYSALLAAAGWVSGLDPLVVARYLNTLLLPLNALLLAWLLRRLVGSHLVALLGALVFVSGWPFFHLHMLAMTEGLFYLLLLLSLVSLEQATARHGVGWPLAAGLLAVAATLTRYAGAALLPAGVLSLFFLRRDGVRWRLVASAVFLVAFALPLAAWLARNAGVGGSTAGRALRFHLTRADIVLNLDTAARWVLPFEMVRQTRILLFLTLSAILGLTMLFLAHTAWQRHGLTDRRVRWLLITIAFSVAYLGVFWGSAALLDSTMRVTTRYMSPIFLLLILLLPTLVDVTPARPDLQVVGRSAMAACAFLLIVSGLSAIHGRARNPGVYLGYTAVNYWGEAGTVEAIRLLDPSATIVTDEVEKVYILTGRPAYVVPIWYDTYKDEPRADFERNMEKMRQRLREGAILVLFSKFDTKQYFLPDRETLTKGLLRVFHARDGDIYVDPEAWAGKPLPWGGVVPEHD